MGVRGAIRRAWIRSAPTDELAVELFERDRRLVIAELAGTGGPSGLPAAGPFDVAEPRSLDVGGFAKESGVVRGEIVACLRELRWRAPVLLSGEYRADMDRYAAVLGCSPDAIVTAGLGDDRHHQWDFEAGPPSALRTERFGLIVSQAMLEHLLDPYRHVRDLASLLDDGGLLVLHTPTQPFAVHRYPVDCVRLLPDWFELAADRLGLQVERRHLADQRVLYALRRP